MAAAKKKMGRLSKLFLGTVFVGGAGFLADHELEWRTWDRARLCLYGSEFGDAVSLGDDDWRVRLASYEAEEFLTEHLGDIAYYVTRKGDTLAVVSERFGLSEAVVMRANPHIDFNEFGPNRCLAFPGAVANGLGDFYDSSGRGMPQDVVGCFTDFPGELNPLDFLLLLDDMVFCEGLRVEAYRCTKDCPTFGVGHFMSEVDAERVKLTPVDERDALAFSYFLKDLGKAARAAVAQLRQLKPEAQTAGMLRGLVSVNFQLGSEWTDDFHETWPAICAGRYDDAIAGIEASAWHRETPVRTGNFIAFLKQVWLDARSPEKSWLYSFGL